jgi:predicted TIM-barrel fold metal-dependent hydrolase
MSDLPIVDAHHHLWDLGKNFYPWLSPRPVPPSPCGDITPIAQNYLIEDYLAEIRNQNVIKSVHVEAGFDYARPVDETRWLQGIADTHGFPHAIVTKVALHDSDAERILAEQSAFQNVRGVRHMINWHDDPSKTYSDQQFLHNDQWVRNYGLLKRHGLSFDLQVYASQMAEAARLAGRHPDTPVVLDHAGMPVDRDPASIELWRAGLKALAGAPHVMVKVSGLGMVDWTWTPDSIRPFVLTIIDTFGTDRVMFGSNFPVDRLYSSYDVLFDAFKDITRDFSHDERRDLFARNAERFYRI